MPTSSQAGDVARKPTRGIVAETSNAPERASVVQSYASRRTSEQPASRAIEEAQPPRQQRAPQRPNTVAQPIRQDDLVFYPAYTFPASPTYHNKWLKLTCREIHNVLKTNDKYAHTNNDISNKNARRNGTPLLLFYHNHPVQYIQIIGIVVAVEEYYEKFWLFTVDDSSGDCLDVTCAKPEKVKGTTTTQTSGIVKKAPPTTDEAGENVLQDTLSSLQIGTTVQAKGQIATFRQTRQLSLLRLNIVPSTTAELALIASRTEFHNDVLSKPWVLSEKEQEKLRKREDTAEKEETEKRERKRRRERMKVEREERHRRRIEQEYAREEAERKETAEIARGWGAKLKKDDGDTESEQNVVWTVVT
jgi:hypothetical protein